MLTSMIAVAALFPLRGARAQDAGPAPVRADSTSIAADTAVVERPAPDVARPGGGWVRFSLGVATSLLAHEGGHLLSSVAVGAHPRIGFDKSRPTVYSGINGTLDPGKQLVFSSSGMIVQLLLNEAILDIPHARGSAFERGVLAGGIGTVLFYATLGRNDEVSDVTWIARTSSLNRTQVALLFGSLAAIQTVRIHLDDHYAHFFAFPTATGGAALGVRVTAEP
ncbi:MAG TPA: hypothetical protein VFK13_04805 [Gemmatimonadaceae bacterium]|nr:hypothetical protein [Gemmatimonadaceae bacterium]